MNTHRDATLMANVNSELQYSKRSSFPSIFNKFHISPKILRWAYSVGTR